jgi:cobalt/nickel transport system permease protein
MAVVRHGADHAHLHVPGETAIHRLPPEAKLVGLSVFVLAVAITPRTALLAFAVDAAVIVAVVAVARVPVRVFAARLLVVVPFLFFALTVPFIAGGEQVDVVGLSLSREGLWGAFNVAAKAILGASASIVLAATTPVPDVVRGLNRLHVPKVVVAIIAFMFRYLDVLVDQTRRMRNAMVARGHDPRWLWQIGPVAASAGTLFVRSYERGERVHQAMAARGFNGTMPELDHRHPNSGGWVTALVPGLIAALALAAAVLLGQRS